MIVSAWLLWLSSFWLLVLGTGGLLITLRLVTEATGSLLYPPLVRLLVIPGVSGLWQVNYPLLPWVSIALLGVVFGRVIEQDSLRARHLSLWGGLSLLVVFGLLRGVNAGEFHPVKAGWMGFLAVTKYPPSPAFVCLTLGVHGLLWWWLNQPGRAVADCSRPDQPLLGQVLVSFGAAPLFFYLLHLYLYMSIGWLFRQGTSLTVIYLVWLIGLVALYPLCRRYIQFKHAKPLDSLWRLV